MRSSAAISPIAALAWATLGSSRQENVVALNGGAAAQLTAVRLLVD